MREPRRFMQVVAGPRQAGKTTLVQSVVEDSDLAHRYASADEPTLRGPTWIEQQWEVARVMTADAGQAGAVLVLDEIQKIPDWSETVKRMWDEDTRARRPLRIVILGSAPLLIARGLSESLAGRFEVIHLPHWSFAEMRDAFGWTLHQFLFFGGYPGAAPLIAEPERWRRYVMDSLIETSISRDVLLLSRIDKPALLRRLFELGCRYSGQILSYTKMLGQLHDAGNTTTLAHYLDLLAGAGMLRGLQKYAVAGTRQRGSSPKLQVFNTALMTAPTGLTLAEARSDTAFWGRLVESAVGAHLMNGELDGDCAVYYWRQGNDEVDFVASAGRRVVAIEVKSGMEAGAHKGSEAFAEAFRPTRNLLVGAGGIELDEFLVRPAKHWMR
ncbi:MAG: ATP-binding protein [Gemmatimonadota bacterium]|nr:ATP-binding protein [Gemmatimonadota bacterium]